MNITDSDEINKLYKFLRKLGFTHNESIDIIINVIKKLKIREV